MARVGRVLIGLGRYFWTLVARHRRVSLAVGAVWFIVVALQCMYPASRSVPFTRLDGRRVGARSNTQIAQLLIDKYSNVDVTLRVAGEAKHTSNKAVLTLTGASPDTQKALTGLRSYPWWQKILPFSVLYAGFFKDQVVQTRVNDDSFDDYAKTVLALCKVDPVNASVGIKSGRVVLNSAKNGQQCNAADLRKQLLATPIRQQGISIETVAKAIKPKRSDKDVAGLLKDAQELADHSIKLELPSQETTVPQDTIASWLEFTENPKNPKKVGVSVSEERIKTYLEGQQQKIYIAPGTTTIHTTDSHETSRQTGAEGRGIDMRTTASALKSQVEKGDGTVKAAITTLKPKVVYERSYSATPAGLQALLNDLAADKGDYGIAVQLLDGTLVSANGNKQYHPASTYKMYVAYSLLKRIEAGSMKWDSAATDGKNISQCLDVMIINSDNTCAEWFGDTIGWSNVQSEVRALGLSSTITLRGSMKSTANDEALFLVKLQSGNILKDAERDRLLDLMRQQRYRSGIPAGVGVTVADKVGFFEGELHDAGLVYNPDKTYALSIMSVGSSWAAIADTAQQINAQISRMY